MEDKYEIKKFVIQSVPSFIGFAFGATVGKTVATAEIIIKGMEYQVERNKDWFDRYLTGAESLELIDDQIKSAKYIQYLREVIQKVAYETRDEKRERLLNIAINYHIKKYSFDKKIKFLQIIDRISIEELHYLFYFYNYVEKAP
jgi:hypothetical protein